MSLSLFLFAHRLEGQGSLLSYATFSLRYLFRNLFYSNLLAPHPVMTPDEMDEMDGTSGLTLGWPTTAPPLEQIGWKAVGVLSSSSSSHDESLLGGSEKSLVKFRILDIWAKRAHTFFSFGLAIPRTHQCLSSANQTSKQ